MSVAIARISGLTLSPAAWAISSQLGQMLPYADCDMGTGWTTFATFLASALAVAGALISLQSHVSTASRSARFISKVGVLFGSSFAFALLLQGAATLLLNPCAR
ncbi:hypothetical protein HFO55_32790 [Rhizobium leguminosarum]|uniref:hypothetical protein n=1 Tax=Rhizobium leguminosarum TaxID=384 RepID=UPI001C9283A6|nr:hypothetical protein [Rhizobium leguminosarum]MBY3488980.1 hypothetical protein [Rhizobium laguerreae]MBY3179521.1 hypothetical protein [Rhizobium leguminosarum]MBY5571910.1 hypothetical protein [Rhizobium leguminosarum]MBY5578446.1 hypothetical protein [Rhizobium leguminosarum]MBY5585132.1 hypothetical protein [Rhizobium leguminosarum]